MRLTPLPNADQAASQHHRAARSTHSATRAQAGNHGPHRLDQRGPKRAHPHGLACSLTMARWYPLESSDAGLFTSAPHVYRYETRYAAPPERVWESLASNASLSAWGSSVKELNWLSPRPFGVGTTREVVLAPGLVRVHERYFRWDEGRGYSF
jgi:Polyketide cyclase / dehydrase and lipid transport